MPSLPLVLTKPFNGYKPPLLYYGLELASAAEEANQILDDYNQSFGLSDNKELVARVVYGCSTGVGWIVKFGHTKAPRLVDEDIIAKVVDKHGKGKPKWYLCFTTSYWHHPGRCFLTSMQH